PPPLLGISLEQPYLLVVLLVPGKRLVFGPPFLFQISNDVQPRRRLSLVPPKFAHVLNACKVMAELAVSHPIGRLARELIQPAMHLFKRLAQHGYRFHAMLCERGHKCFTMLSTPITWQTNDHLRVRIWHGWTGCSEITSLEASLPSCATLA